MDIVIFDGSFNDRYRNNSTYIAFTIQDNLIHIEENDWNVRAACLLSG